MDDMNEIDFSKLINDVHLLKYLTLNEILMLKLTSKQINDLVKTYMSKHRKPHLKLPANMVYTEHNKRNLYQNILKACNSLKKEPRECIMSVSCTISHSEDKTVVQINPPFEALEHINRSGVRILLNILFVLPSSNIFDRTWVSYIFRLEQILKTLTLTESINLDFSDETFEGGWNRGTWFNNIRIALLNLPHLSSLKISGEAPWNHILPTLPLLTQLRELKISGTHSLGENQITDCLSHMPQLTSLSINDMTINANRLILSLSIMPQLTSFKMSKVQIEGLLNFQQFGQLLELVLPEVSTLELSSSFLEAVPIYEILPYMRLLLSKLVSLHISNNNLDINTILPLFRFLENLVELNISNSDIDSRDIAVFIPALQQLPFLRSLDVSSNNIGIPAILDLKQSLRRLNVLNVSNNEQIDMDSLE